MDAVRTRTTIDIDGADAVIAAAEARAREQGSRVFIAVVDPAGELVALRRTRGAQVASARVAVDKARTAAIFVRPSREIEQQVSDGRLGALALHGAAALTGGIPLEVDGEVVGAIGVSGASSADEDQALAQLGARAAEAAASGPGNGHAAYFASDQVAARFASGGLLLEKPRYKIDAGRRTGPGDVEVHAHEVDVMHVLQGAATVVAGADTHELHEGDVLEIPAGVSHQFTDASDPFLYFVVKVTT